MSDGIYLALSGAVAQSSALEAIADNVANASTTGHRAERVTFAQALSDAGGPQVVAERGARDQRPGPIVETGNPLDLALEGPGWLVVQGGAGAEMVRSASFHLDAEGRLIDGSGRALLDESGAELSVPPDARSISVSSEGRVLADGEEIGRLLSSASDRWVVPAADDPGVTIRAGALESSNVQVVRGMVDLIQASRTFEALTRALENHKTIDERTAREVGNAR